MQRVKVYRLNEDGQWDDRGTGHVKVDYLEQSEELGLYVIDEDDNSTLLVHRVTTGNVYKRQEDAIISWSDPEHSVELALSFEETVGCTHVWDYISSTQRILQFNSLNSETFDNVMSELKELPGVSRANLPLILKIITENGIAGQMRLTELILKDVHFVEKLMDVFEDCEKANDVSGLCMMFDIVAGIITLNSSEIRSKILGDQLFMKIVGCLEYDPDVPQSQHHRTFLREQVVFKEAIPIKDPLVVTMIHQTYRLGYLKDVVLANVLDDATSANLQSVIDANNATIVTALKDDIQELFASLRSPSTSEESRNNLVHFLHDYCSLSKSLQTVQKVSVLRKLLNEGIIDIIAEVLKSPDKKLVLMGIDILSILWAQDITLLCSYIVRAESPLLGLLVKGMMEDFGDKMEWQCLDIFQTVLEKGLPAQKAIIVDIFCEKHLLELVNFIAASSPERPGDTSEAASVRVGSHHGAKTEVLLHICELLCSCAQLDPSRINFLHNNVIEKVLLLTRRKEKPLVAAGIRFVRALLSVRNDNVQNYIVENNSLKPIIDVFVADGHRNNLLTSAILELLEQIRKKHETVLKYVVDTFWDQLAPFEYLPSIQAFRTKYEKCLESKEPDSTTDPVDMDEEKPASDTNTQKEEANPHDSNVAASSSTSRSRRPNSGGLVDDEDSEEAGQGEAKRPRLSPSEENKNSPEQGSEAKEEP